MQKVAARFAGKPNKAVVAKAPEAVLANEREKLAEAAILKLLAQQTEIAAL